MTIEEAEKKIDTLEDQVMDLTSCVDDLIEIIEEILANRESTSMKLVKVRRYLPKFQDEE